MENSSVDARLLVLGMGAFDLTARINASEEMKMKMLKIAAATICTVAAFAGAASAATISNAASGLANPDALVTFDEVPLAQNTSVSNQFESQGLTFSAGVQMHRLNLPFLNLFGRNLSNYSPITRTFSIFFVDDVSDATFSMLTHFGRSTLTAKLDGQTVESFSAYTYLLARNNFFGFTGLRFDEIEVQAGGFNGAMILDNVSYNSAPLIPNPVPGSLPLMAGGAIAFGVLRMRRRSS